MREILVGPEGAGQRLDKYLQKYMAKAPGSVWRRETGFSCSSQKRPLKIFVGSRQAGGSFPWRSWISSMKMNRCF